MSLPSGLLLADKSAWERAGDPKVRSAWTEALVGDRIVTCMPVRYELLFSTRSAEEYVALETRLSQLRDLPLSAPIQRAAAAAMRELAGLGPLHHRIPLPDLLVAAVAQEHGAVVVHEDQHFERLTSVLAFEAERLLPV